MASTDGGSGTQYAAPEPSLITPMLTTMLTKTTTASTASPMIATRVLVGPQHRVVGALVYSASTLLRVFL